MKLPQLSRTPNGPLLTQDDKNFLLPIRAPWYELVGDPDLHRRLMNARTKGVQVSSDQASKLLAQPIIPFQFPYQRAYGAGVTYKVSQAKRNEESTAVKPDYDYVGEPEHWPELFNKASYQGHTFCHGQNAGIRSDSGMGGEAWDVPEPELVLNCPPGAVMPNALTLGLDMSSRSIEGPSGLLLPQAKEYQQCAGFARSLVVPEHIDQVFPIDIRMVIYEDDRLIYDSEMSTEALRRTYEVLLGALNRMAPSTEGFKHAMALFTGTGMVPDNDTLTQLRTVDGKFTLCANRHRIKVWSKTLGLELSCGVDEVFYQPRFGFEPGAAARYKEVAVINHLPQ